MRLKLLVLAAFVVGLLPIRGYGTPGEIAEFGISFRVANTNTSKLPCPSDGREYDLDATLVAPVDAPSSVTVYVPGATGGQWQWRLDQIPGRDNMRLLAQDGHASVVIDRLGQGTSGRPHGRDMCVGSEADVLHQVVQKLRHGAYESAGVRPTFQQVAVAGHSLGSVIALTEAYSYNDVEALVLSGWAHVPTALARFVSHLSRVGPRYATCASDEDGYVTVWPTSDEAAGDLFYDPDSAVVQALDDVMEQASCGSQGTLAYAIAASQVQAGTIDVPMLVINGEHDFGFDPTATDAERHRYPRSPDVDAVVVPDAGHTFMIERSDTARIFRAVVGSWLQRRGF